MSDIKKIVLAYSGGLDTSVILKWLKETHNCPVVAFCADIGQGEEVAEVADKARATGADEVFVEDLQEEFARDFVFPILRANAIYEGSYLMGTSIARPLIAKGQVEVAKKNRGGCGEPRRHRQGQRPGALRGHLPGPGP
jgi:argininosuccinate synthase